MRVSDAECGVQGSCLRVEVDDRDIEEAHIAIRLLSRGGVPRACRAYYWLDLYFEFVISFISFYFTLFCRSVFILFDRYNFDFVWSFFFALVLSCFVGLFACLFVCLFVCLLIRLFIIHYLGV